MRGTIIALKRFSLVMLLSLRSEIRDPDYDKLAKNCHLITVEETEPRIQETRRPMWSRRNEIHIFFFFFFFEMFMTTLPTDNMNLVVDIQSLVLSEIRISNQKYQNCSLWRISRHTETEDMLLQRCNASGI